MSLDPATIEVLRAPLKVQQEACATMGVPFCANGYVFTRDGLGDEPWVPDSVTQRFDRMRGQLGLNCRLHDLRHYTATQLLAAGIDFVTTGAGRHDGGGGCTTLNAHAHWDRLSDQRAADMLARGLQKERGRGA